MAAVAQKKMNPESIEKLVEELMKDVPNNVIVKKLMTECGMIYNTDYFSQISTVISTLSTKAPLKKDQIL